MKMFLKFGTVGFFNTLITLGSYTLFIYIGINYLAANVLGYFLGVINSYYWNKKWVFQDRTEKASVFFKFIAVNILTLAFNTFALYILVSQLDFHPVLANVFAIGSGLALNYIMNYKWTFNQPS
jgi:putative flippase GtrA